MLLAIMCYDKPASVELRIATRPAHVEYLKSAGVRVKIAGRIMSPGDTPEPVGSLIIIDAASETAVQLFADNDPYATAGLFDKVEIQPWKRAIGAWGNED